MPQGGAILRGRQARLTCTPLHGTITPVDEPQPCVFCDRIASGQIVAQNDLSVAIPDAYPVMPGHTLVVPRRHVTEFFDLTDDEQAAVWRLAAVVRANLL